MNYKIIYSSPSFYNDKLKMLEYFTEHIIEEIKTLILHCIMTITVTFSRV